MIFILLFYKYLSHLCKKQSESIPGALREHYSHSRSTSGAFRDNSRNNSGTFRGAFREHYNKAAGCLSCSRQLFRFILISLFFSSVSRHLSAPFECCPPVIHLGSDHGKQLCPDGVLFHFLIKTVFLHHLQAFDHVRDFLRGICS